MTECGKLAEDGAGGRAGPLGIHIRAVCDENFSGALELRSLSFRLPRPPSSRAALRCR